MKNTGKLHNHFQCHIIHLIWIQIIITIHMKLHFRFCLFIINWKIYSFTVDCCGNVVDSTNFNIIHQILPEKVRKINSVFLSKMFNLMMDLHLDSWMNTNMCNVNIVYNEWTQIINSDFIRIAYRWCSTFFPVGKYIISALCSIL